MAPIVVATDAKLRIRGLPMMVPATMGEDRDASDGVDSLTFGWAGSVEPGQSHYYRLQGPTFLLEFDNSRNHGAHIHSVRRDFEQDFGGDPA